MRITLRTKRVSLKDVAGRLGLHKSTVSRALRHDPRIPAETRKKVQQMCEKLDYQTNSLISELASARWQMGTASKGTSIAYIDRTQSSHLVQGPYGIYVPLRDQAEALGYQLAVFRWYDFDDPSKLQKALRNRGITDVIIGFSFDESQIELDWEKLICVQLLPGSFPLPLHSVVKDHFNSVVLAWQKAVVFGYQRIGIVLLDHSIRLMDDILRLSAAKACQEQIFPSLAALEPFQFTALDMRGSDFVRWVKTEQPDVIIGFSGSHYAIYETEFKRAIPYIALHSDGNVLSGILSDESISAREAINLLHFCRRTHQWGIPEKRIDHVMEPTWFEGSTLPSKNRL